MWRKWRKTLLGIAITVMLAMVSVTVGGPEKGNGRAVMLVCLAGIVITWAIILPMTIADARRGGKDLKARYGASLSGRMPHVSGLPVAGGVTVDVLYCGDRLVFLASGKEMELGAGRIMSVDVARRGNSSRDAMVGGAAGAVAIGGVAGAAIGASAAVSEELVISYDGDKAIRLGADGDMGAFARKVAKAYARDHKTGGSAKAHVTL